MASAAQDWIERAASLKPHISAEDRWARLSAEMVASGAPFDVQAAVYETIYADWDAGKGPPPAWRPTEESASRTHLGQLMAQLGHENYDAFHAWSVRNYPEFWETMIRRLGILFATDFESVVDLSGGVESPRWLPGARMNIAASCLTAPDDAIAILYQPAGGAIRTTSYGELARMTSRVAGSLAAQGYQPGDALGVALPMSPEAVAIDLGIVKAGCVAVGIAESLAPTEMQARLRISGAKAVFTQSVVRQGGTPLPLFETVCAAEAPRAIVLDAPEDEGLRLRKGDLLWRDFLSGDEQPRFHEASPGDWTHLLFSSGTTGDPKAIPWTHTTPIKCAVDGHLHQDIQPGDRVAWPTSLGWMMGPWLIYAGLINRGTLAIYGGAAAKRGFGRFIAEAGVNILGVVPSLVRGWRATRCMRDLDWSSIKAFSSTGECSNPSDMLYLMALAGYRPVIEYCGGTEIGGGYLTGTLVQPCSPSTFTTPAAGIDMVILDESGQPAEAGEVMLVPPSIGLSTELANADHHAVYHAGAPRGPNGETLRRHGDAIERLPGGYYRAHGRVDDTMNLGGIKVSSAEIERIATGVDGVREAAAVGAPPPGGGPDRLILYIVPREDAEGDARALTRDIQAALKAGLSRLLKVHEVQLLQQLPRTASNKVMRRTLRDAYQRAEQTKREAG